MNYAYTKDEIRELKRLFHQFMPVRNIAKVLHRSEGSIIQKCRALGLKRDHHVVLMLAKSHDRDLLKYGKTSKAIKAALARLHKKEVNDRAKSHAKVKSNGLKILKKLLELKTDRDMSIRAAFNAGATLSEIGKVVGMTKQGVSLIVKKGPNYEK